ncbi:arginine--tRNA ligase [bacterium]|nr:arginine--tRNA ligase [bacterium]
MVTYLANPLKELQGVVTGALNKSSYLSSKERGLARELQFVVPPRPSGFKSTICFDVAGTRLKDELDVLEAEYGKKKAKKLIMSKSRKLASELAGNMADELQAFSAKQPMLKNIEAEGGYLNFYFETAEVARAVLSAILPFRDESVRAHMSGFGSGAAKTEKVMVEYSQPNTHKPFHVGHTRNVALGVAVSNILEYYGYPVVRANYIGDIGAHVIKCLWAIRKFPGEFDDVEDPLTRLGEYYALSDRAERDGFVKVKAGRIETPTDTFKSEIKELFLAWEKDDPDVISLWRKTREESLNSFDDIYKCLGARFDHVFYESEVEDEGKKCVEDLLERGVAEIGRDGDYKDAVFVDFDSLLSGSDLRQMVILRADGTSLYQTKELALARRKFIDFNIDRSIYIVATEQSFYFKQIFAILRLWGFPQADKCVHLPYEIVMLPEGKMSSRSGTVVLFNDLMNETLARLYEITTGKGYATDAEGAARKIAVGAIKFSMLNVDHNKVVVFDWEKALNFSGQACPYVQYMAVRARRILAEARDFEPANTDEIEISGYEEKLVIMLGRFPEVIRQAAEELAPYHLTRFAFEISQRFGEFYRFCPVLKCEEPLRSFRLSVVFGFSYVLESTLKLLGIEVPEAM